MKMFADAHVWQRGKKKVTSQLIPRVCLESVTLDECVPQQKAVKILFTGAAKIKVLPQNPHEWMRDKSHDGIKIEKQAA